MMRTNSIFILQRTKKKRKNLRNESWQSWMFEVSYPNWKKVSKVSSFGTKLSRFYCQMKRNFLLSTLSKYEIRIIQIKNILTRVVQTQSENIISIDRSWPKNQIHITHLKWIVTWVLIYLLKRLMIRSNQSKRKLMKTLQRNEEENERWQLKDS